MSAAIELKFRVPKTLKSGQTVNKLHRVVLTPVAGRFEVTFNYEPFIIAEIKSMKGARWHGFEDPPRKIWSISNCARNLFQLAFLSGGNPYAPYECPLLEFKSNRDILMAHQVEIAAHFLTRRQCIVAAEMRTGKTLSVIEVMEQSGVLDWLWVAPRSALYSVELEFRKWNAKITPSFITYDGLRKYTGTPQGVIFDESSRLKNPTAQRTIAAEELSERIRAKYGHDAWLCEMSGSPSPKDPGDWHSQCEIACPGFIREGDLRKFKNRLAIIVQKESISGGVFPHLVTWKDDEKKCAECGQLEGDRQHDLSMGGHAHIESVNEVSKLYRRMKGLVLVKKKKDCMDLPDKQYVEIELKPSPETKRLESLIKASAPSAIQALTLMRELSDGFQYSERKEGTTKCPACNGLKVQRVPVDIENPSDPISPEEAAKGHRSYVSDDGEILWEDKPLKIEVQEVPCDGCKGTGIVEKIIRTVDEVSTPKDDALKNLLDQHDEVGRLVVYGGFTASIDRITAIVKRCGWEYIRADGRGWSGSIEGKPTELLETFQKNQQVDRLCFIGHPNAGGMGIELAASPSIVYYSNDFSAEGRVQSEARIHSLAMNRALGATIYDLLHLNCDRIVLNNLKAKKRLEDMTLGQLQMEFANVERRTG